MSRLRRSRLARLTAAACVVLVAGAAPSMADAPPVPGLETIGRLIPAPDTADAPEPRPRAAEVPVAEQSDDESATAFASAPAPSAVPSLGEFAARVIALTNRDRAAAGCLPLTAQALLDESAQEHAEEMSRKVYFSHASLDGRTFDQRIRDTGYQGRELGENIASGFATADEVQTAWMATPAHRKNILDCAFREIGVGFAPNGQYWVVNFGG